MISRYIPSGVLPVARPSLKSGFFVMAFATIRAASRLSDEYPSVTITSMMYLRELWSYAAPFTRLRLNHPAAPAAGFFPSCRASFSKNAARARVILPRRGVQVPKLYATSRLAKISSGLPRRSGWLARMCLSKSTGWLKSSQQTEQEGFLTCSIPNWFEAGLSDMAGFLLHAMQSGTEYEAFQ